MKEVVRGELTNCSESLSLETEHGLAGIVREGRHPQPEEGSEDCGRSCSSDFFVIRCDIWWKHMGWLRRGDGEASQWKGLGRMRKMESIDKINIFRTLERRVRGR